MNIHKVIPFKLVKTEGNHYTFEASFEASEAGAYKCDVRNVPEEQPAAAPSGLRLREVDWIRTVWGLTIIKSHS